MPVAAFSKWVGQSVETTDIAAAGQLRRLAATLGCRWDGAIVPPLAHWLFHLPEVAQSELGSDGHPTKGGFLPPFSQPRRMWAGGRLQFLSPLRVGAEMRKRSTIVDIVTKSGPAGDMVFVTLRHVIVADGQDAIVEEQDLVYLPIAPPASPKAVALPEPVFERSAVLDETVLFRFSALTFNAHRIHYDLPYARESELYPALVVQAPLQAMLLVGLARSNSFALNRFSFRARAPLYAGQPFVLAQTADDLWIRDVQGNVTMTASIAS